MQRSDRHKQEIKQRPVGLKNLFSICCREKKLFIYRPDIRVKFLDRLRVTVGFALFENTF